MPFAIPPWLQVNPSQFTQAAIAGGEQGFRAASEAGQLAQHGLLSAVQLAQEAAARAADIAVRREQINASLAENAARVSAAQAEAAAQNSLRQQNLELEKLKEENAVNQEANRLAAAQSMQTEKIAGEKDVANIRANAPREFSMSEFGKMAAEMNALPPDDPLRAIYQQRMDSLANVNPRKAQLSGADQAELAAARKSLQDIFAKYQSGELATWDQDALKQRTELQTRIRELESRTNPGPATPAAPAAAPRLRYQLLSNGQLQLVQ